ncbi:MAG TPA: hypothetical protein PLA54_12835 [Spirochaetota bacterium]|nr:hypothetical protein [Spirochaetota bacterium]HQE60067.1 hypothetical protein [Spirochaetota bacterium]
MKPAKILILSESTTCFNNVYSDYFEIERRINIPDSFQDYLFTAVDIDSKIALREIPLSTVAFSKEFSPKTEAEMKNKLIPFFLNHNYLKNNFNKVSRIFSKSYTNKKIAVFSPNKERNTVLKAVLRLFNYDMIEIINFNDLFSLNDSEISFIFADISSKSFSSEQYVKKAVFGRLKFVPFIPFYTENGIGISDVACGLNKVARFILNFDEMMSFISHNFSSHEIFNENKKLNDFFKTNINNNMFSQDLKSDYHQNYSNMIHTRKNFSDSDDNLISQIAELDESMTKRELVKWFIIDDNSNHKAKV